MLRGAFLCLSFWLFANGLQSLAELPQPRWVSPAESPFLADEGKCLLHWELAQSESGSFIFQVQQAQNTDFSDARMRYEGSDLATYISGLPQGAHLYRVRAVSGEETGLWSEPMEVNVEFVSQKLVITLFLLGTIVFMATVWAIWKGHCQYAESSDSTLGPGGKE